MFELAAWGDDLKSNKQTLNELLDRLLHLASLAILLNVAIGQLHALRSLVQSFSDLGHDFTVILRERESPVR